mgnify:CR=1 FL=1
MEENFNSKTKSEDFRGCPSTISFRKSVLGFLTSRPSVKKEFDFFHISGVPYKNYKYKVQKTKSSYDALLKNYADNKDVIVEIY